MTTEAGKRLADELQVAYRIDLIAAIEAEAAAAERARLAEAVRRTFDPYDGPWQQDQREGWEDCRAAVLAILEK